MNCEPCNSLEIICNHNITIGYLKELVANIPIECCTNISVNGVNDAYCPTYGELINGSIIPAFVDGGNGSWSNNVDGVFISLGYSNNQCVAKKDLKLIYTAFEGLTVENNSPIVSECGGTTTTNKILTFRKYIKECNKLPESTTQTDMSLPVTWYGTDNTNTGVKTYERNDDFNNTHESVVSCSTIWRGCNYSSSNSITVSQKNRQFGRNDDINKESGTSLSVYCYPTEFDCAGGTSHANATYFYTEWVERHYIDSCGYEYGQSNINIIDKNKDVSSYLNATSHTYNACVKTTPAESRFEFKATYSGFSGNAFCEMSCDGCNTCPPPNYTSYTDITASCYSLSATVTGVSHTFTGGHIDGEGNCVDYEETTANTSYTVSWDCNTAGGWVDAHVLVTGSPCCETSITYTYDDYEVQCESANTIYTGVGWTCVVHNADGTITTSNGTNIVKIPAHDYNITNEIKVIQEGNSGTTLEIAKPRVLQTAGPCYPTACTYTYDAVTIPCSGAPTTVKSVKWTRVYTNAYSATTTTSGFSNKSILGASCNPTNIEQVIQEGNTGTTAVEANPRIIQEAGPCCETGDVYTYDAVTIPCYGASPEMKEVYWTRVHTNADSTTTTTRGKLYKPIPGASCNPTNDEITLQEGNTGTTMYEAEPKITQNGGPCCSGSVTYSYDTITIQCSGESESNKTVKWTKIEVKADTTTEITTGESEIHISSSSCNPNMSINVIQEGKIGPTLGEAKPRIIQAAGPCCETSITYTYTEVINVNCESAGAYYVEVPWECVIYYPDNTSKTTNGINNVMINERECNTTYNEIILQEGKTGTTLDEAKPRIIQAAGPCCDFSLTSVIDMPAVGRNDALIGTYEANKCVTTLLGSSDSNWVNNIRFINGEIYADIITYDDTILNRTAEITVVRNMNENDCKSVFNLTQNHAECKCNMLSIDKPSLTFSRESGETQVITITHDRCISGIEIETNTAPIFDVSSSSTLTSVTVSATTKEVNTTQDSIINSLTINYSAGSSICQDSIVLIQLGTECNCNDLLLIVSSDSAWTYDNKSVKEVASISSGACITDITVSSSSDEFSINIYNGIIRVTPNDYNDTSSDKTATITVNYKANNAACVPKTFDVVQHKLEMPCDVLPPDIKSGITITFEAYE